jgi:hypothetical protein
VSDTLYAPPRGGGQIVCTHGHHFSMVNAPDFINSPADGLPFAHFITRTSALWATQTLAAKYPPGTTAAALPSSGDPTGWPLVKSVLCHLFQNVAAGKGSLARSVIDALLEATHQRPDLRYTMFDGSTLTAAEVMNRYASIYEHWRDEGRFPPRLFGESPGLFAMAEVDGLNSLHHFAELLARDNKVIVMGHTHAAREDGAGLCVMGRSLYANCGFGCPSIPDMHSGVAAKWPTFVEVEVDEAHQRFVAGVRYVRSDGGVSRVAGEPLTPAKSVPMR